MPSVPNEKHVFEREHGIALVVVEATFAVNIWLVMRACFQSTVSSAPSVTWCSNVEFNRPFQNVQVGQMCEEMWEMRWVLCGTHFPHPKKHPGQSTRAPPPRPLPPRPHKLH